MLGLISLILISSLLFTPINPQKIIREKGESFHPYLVNMWIPKNKATKQETSRFCDAIQLTPFTDYFFTSSKCFDNLEHEMWLENIGISYDENIVQYSRHMSFLTRYKEEGGHFVILERFEANPLEYGALGSIRQGKRQEAKNVTKKSEEIEDMTKAANEMVEAVVETISVSTQNPTTPSLKIDDDEGDEDYEDFPNDLAQDYDLEENYEIKGQVEEDPNIKHLRMMRNRKVKLSTPDIRGVSECYVLGWGTYLKQYASIRDLEGLSLKKEIVHKLTRKQCKDPDPSHLCVVKADGENRECVEDLGSPLVCEKRDNKNFTIGIALVGIYTGFKNCVTTDVGIFRSLTSELPWIARWAKGTPIITGFSLDNRMRSASTRSRKSRRRVRRRRRRGASNSIQPCLILILLSSFFINRYLICLNLCLQY